MDEAHQGWYGMDSVLNRCQMSDASDRVVCGQGHEEDEYLLA